MTPQEQEYIDEPAQGVSDEDMSEEEAKELLGKKLEEMTDEQKEKLNALVQKYREKMYGEYIKQMKKSGRKNVPKSFFTKKGPGKGRKPKRK